MSAINLKTEERFWRLSEIGYILHRLESASARTPIIAKDGRFGVLDDVDHLRKSFAELDLAETDSIFVQPSEIDEFFAFLKLESKLRNRLTSVEAKVIRVIAYRLSEQLEQEARKRTVFVAQRSRTNDIEQFLHDPRSYFGLVEDVFVLLDEKGEKDFHEAARCYSVNFISASMMFALRAMEQILRSYYEHVTGTKVERQNWGALQGILKLKVLACPPQLLTLLKTLQDERNKTMHPDKSNWTEEETKEIINNCNKCIKLMMGDLKKRNG